MTVDTIRFYQREGLLPAAERVGRTKVYGPVHRERLEQIRDLQQRRFSLAAIKALLDTDRPGIDGRHLRRGRTDYAFEELVDRSGVDGPLADRLRDSGCSAIPPSSGATPTTPPTSTSLPRPLPSSRTPRLAGRRDRRARQHLRRRCRGACSRRCSTCSPGTGPGWKDTDELWRSRRAPAQRGNYSRTSRGWSNTSTNGRCNGLTLARSRSGTSSPRHRVVPPVDGVQSPQMRALPPTILAFSSLGIGPSCPR